MKVYQVIHCFDVDGGFGDAIYEEDLVFVTTNKEKVEEYVKRWSHPHVYYEPYDKLYKGELKISEIEVLNEIDIEKSPEDYGCFFWEWEAEEDFDNDEEEDEE